MAFLTLVLTRTVIALERWCGRVDVLLYVSLLEVQCLALPTWDFGQFDTLFTSVGTHVNYSCVSGYRLENGENEMSAVCTAQGIWHPDIVRCEGTGNIKATRQQLLA